MSRAILTVDLGFGDAGKGSIVDFLTRQHDAHTVIRFSGGAQAGHRVVGAGRDPSHQKNADPCTHVFSQFGAGTFAGAATHHSRFMMIEPFAMQAEADHLQTIGIDAPFNQLTIDQSCLVTTPFHRAINRLKEMARGRGRHGSCGIGVGETMADFVSYGDQVLKAADFANPDTLYARLRFLQQRNQCKLKALNLPKNHQVEAETAVFTDSDIIDWLMTAYQTFADQVEIVHSTYLHHLLGREGTVIFEASQGVLLDEWFGFHPHTTWSTVTFANADTLLREANYQGKVSKIGITRAYATRHGAGPFVTEDLRLANRLPDAANGDDDWQEGFRVGWLDLVMLRYAKAVVGHLDYLAVCHLDRLADLESVQLCHSYLYQDNLLTTLPKKKMLEDLTSQEALTQQLLECVPLYTPVSSPKALLHRLEKTLGVPVGIESWGETAADKKDRRFIKANVPPLTQ